MICESHDLFMLGTKKKNNHYFDHYDTPKSITSALALCGVFMTEVEVSELFYCCLL